MLLGLDAGRSGLLLVPGVEVVLVDLLEVEDRAQDVARVQVRRLLDEVDLVLGDVRVDLGEEVAEVAHRSLRPGQQGLGAGALLDQAGLRGVQQRDAGGLVLGHARVGRRPVAAAEAVRDVRAGGRARAGACWRWRIAPICWLPTRPASERRSRGDGAGAALRDRRRRLALIVYTGPFQRFDGTWGAADRPVELAAQLTAGWGARRAAGTGTRRRARRPAGRSCSAARARSGRAIVSRTSISVPRRSERLRKRRVQVDRLRRCESTRRRTTSNGQPRPVAAHLDRRVAREPPRRQPQVDACRCRAGPRRCAPSRVIGGNGSIRPSQFSSTSLPIASGQRRAGPRRRRRCSPAGAACRRGRGRRLIASTPEQSSSIPLSGTSVAPGPDRRARVVAVGGTADAVAVRVALDLLARDPRVGVVGDRRVVAAAAVDLASACPSRATTLSLPGAAVERVDPAAAEEPVVAGAAVEDDRERDARRSRRRCRRRRSRLSTIRVTAPFGQSIVCGRLVARRAAGVLLDVGAAEAREADRVADVEAGDLVALARRRRRR